MSPNSRPFMKTSKTKSLFKCVQLTLAKYIYFVIYSNRLLKDWSLFEGKFPIIINTVFIYLTNEKCFFFFFLKKKSSKTLILASLNVYLKFFPQPTPK